MIRSIESALLGRLELVRLEPEDIVRHLDCDACGAKSGQIVTFEGERLCPVCFVGAIACNPDHEPPLTRAQVISETCAAFCVESIEALGSEVWAEIVFQTEASS